MVASIEALESRTLLSAVTPWLAVAGGPGGWIQGTESTSASVISDAAGNVYVSGTFSGVQDFDLANDPGDGSDILSTLNDQSCFVAKYTSGGSLDWVQQINGALWLERVGVRETGVGLDAELFLTGAFGGTPGAVGGSMTLAGKTMTAVGRTDGFLAKLDTSGTFQWAVQFGGPSTGEGWNPGWDHGSNVVATQDGSVYVTGRHSGLASFESIGGPSGTADSGSEQGVFFARYTSDGTLEWVKGIGAAKNLSRKEASGFDLSVEDVAIVGGKLYASGGFRSRVDFDPDPGHEVAAFGNYYEGYVLKLNAQDGSFDWVRTTTGNGGFKGLAAGTDGSVYVVGDFWQDAASTPKTITFGGISLTTSGIGNGDAFLARLDAEGIDEDGDPADGNVVWVRQVAGASAYDLAVDPLSGDVIAAGKNEFVSADFDPNPSQDYVLRPGGYLWRLNADGDFVSAVSVGFAAGEVHVGTDGTVAAVGSILSHGEVVGFPNGTSYAGPAGETWSTFVVTLSPDAPAVRITGVTTVQEGSSDSLTATAADPSLIEWFQNGATTGITGGSLSLSTLAAGTHTFFAQVTDPTSGLIGMDSITVAVTPKAPTLLSATVSGPSVTLAWQDNSAGETGFVIERALKPKGSASPSWSVRFTTAAGAVSYAENPGTGTWLYRVRAIAGSASSAASGHVTVSVTTKTSTTSTASATTLSASDAVEGVVLADADATLPQRNSGRMDRIRALTPAGRTVHPADNLLIGGGFAAFITEQEVRGMTDLWAASGGGDATPMFLLGTGKATDDAAADVRTASAGVDRLFHISEIDKATDVSKLESLFSESDLDFILAM